MIVGFRSRRSATAPRKRIPTAPKANEVSQSYENAWSLQPEQKEGSRSRVALTRSIATRSLRDVQHWQDIDTVAIKIVPKLAVAPERSWIKVSQLTAFRR